MDPGRAVEAWLERRRITLPKPARVETTCLKVIVRFFGAHRRVDQITACDLERYQVWRRQSLTRRGTPVEPRTVNLEVFYLSLILKKAKHWARVAPDYKRLPIEREGPGKALAPEQVYQLVQVALPNPEWLVTLCATIEKRVH